MGRGLVGKDELKLDELKGEESGSDFVTNLRVCGYAGERVSW